MSLTLNAARPGLTPPFESTITPKRCCGKWSTYVANDAHPPLWLTVGCPRYSPCETPNAYGIDDPSFSFPRVRVSAIAALPPTFASSKLITHFARSSTVLNNELDPSAVRLFVTLEKVLSGRRA